MENNLLIQAKERLKEVNVIQKTLFLKGVHFGEIPGVKRQVLLKVGAELLMQLYGLVPHFKETIEPVGANGLDRRIMVTASILNNEGRVIGNGYGFASTLEDRYKWRKASGKEEYDSIQDSERRTIRTGKDLILQVRQNPDNCLNTIIKMARKRAMVDAVLTIFSLSGQFSQDLEDEVALPPIPQSTPSNQEPRKTPKTNTRAFLKAVDDLKKMHGPDLLREAEKAASVDLRSLAEKDRALQVEAYEKVRNYLKSKKEAMRKEENIFATASR